MTLSEYAADITDKLGKTDTTSVAICKRFVRRRYEFIYNDANWTDSLCLASRTASSHILILPQEVEHVISVRWNDREILPVDQQILFQIDPQIFERSGSPFVFSHLTPVGVSTQPSSERMSFASSSSGDTSKSVVIRGELSGTEKVETVTLNGTSTVSTTNSFDTIYTLAKDVTSGTVTVTGFTSAATLATLWDVERERKFIRIRLHEQPSDATKTILILAKRRLRQLTNDNDTPIVRCIDNALIALATADMLERERQYGKAQLKAQEGLALLKNAKDIFTYNDAHHARVIPVANGEYGPDDFGGVAESKAYF